MKNILLMVLIPLISIQLVAQQYISVIQEQNTFYNTQGIEAEEYYQINKSPETSQTKQINNCQLNKMVFGWHPFWQNGYESNYDWDLISDFCYFSYEVEPSTGNAATTHSFETTSVVDDALASGTNVHLCVTLFENHSTLLESATAKQTLIDNLIDLISNRSAHGVNIDFEAISSTQKTNLTNFMIDLSQQMHAAIPGSIVSIDLPAVDWNATFEVGAMSPYVDYFMIMGYDYYWGGSNEAGPHSPLYTFNNGYDYNLSKSISFYTHAGAPEEQLVMGVPYYGREWATVNNNIPSSTTATGSTITYKSVMNNVSGNYTNRLWDDNSKTPYYVYNDGEWNQCFSDDEESLMLRYDMVHNRNLAGIGIWALGYDDGYTELWDAISEKLTDCRVVACSDTIYDAGGANHNYYNYEDYITTIAPTNAIGLTLDFQEFELENEWDTLWIYDGIDTNAPEIGNYTYTNSPGLITASAGALTLKFHSDITTTAPGFKAVWQCVIDHINPTTTIQVINDWQTQDFTVDFTDDDNQSVESLFYQIVENDGVALKANPNNGYFYDDFDVNIDQWTLQDGVWNADAGTFNQTDESLSNTNSYASLIQDNSHSYLYHWQMKISGVGANRRAGIYFFSDDATQDQRNNSYMVYFRVDQNKCQLYKSINNTIEIKTDDTCVVDVDVWYDYKILFEPNSGKIRAYQNNQLVSEWIDASPHSSASFISLRTGNCNVSYDNFKVYKSRTAQITATLGNASDKDIRVQNANPATSSCQIKSIVKDVNDNFSSIVSEEVNIDWTQPDEITEINDGTASDIDTSYVNTSLDANWLASTDEHSGVVKYWYAIGTLPEGVDILDWTDNLEELTFNESLFLDYEQIYYVSVKAENGAGLLSNIIFSDGVLILDEAINIDEILQDNSFVIYPNPAVNQLTIDNGQFAIGEIQIMDITGKIVKQFKIQDSRFNIKVEDLKKGLYIIKVGDKKQSLIIQ